MDFAEALKLVRWDLILGMSAVPLILQFLAAIIHPVAFKIVSALTIIGIIALALIDGTSLNDQTALAAQLIEMVSVLVVVLIGHNIIRNLFTAMARASR